MIDLVWEMLEKNADEASIKCPCIHIPVHTEKHTASFQLNVFEAGSQTCAVCLSLLSAGIKGCTSGPDLH